MVITPTPPVFEHHRSAIGIAETAPRMSWILPEAPTGWTQRTYEVAERPLSDDSDGRSLIVESNDSVLVPWANADRKSVV